MSQPRFSLHFSQQTHHQRIHLFHRNRRRVQWWRRGFLIVLSLVAVIGLWYGARPWYRTWRTLESAQQSIRILKKEGISGLTLHVQDHQKRPIVVQATQASEVPDHPMTYRLEDPQGRIDFEDGRKLFITSQQGIVDRHKRHITMTKHVQTHDTMGYKVRTEEAYFDLDQQQAQGSLYVEGEGPTSAWTGQGFLYNWDAEHLRLKGPATLTLETAP